MKQPIEDNLLLEQEKTIVQPPTAATNGTACIIPFILLNIPFIIGGLLFAFF